MTLTIAGGTYHELCLEGDWQQMFGSGLRAAAALARRGQPILYTFVAEMELSLVQTIAHTFGVRLSHTSSSQSVTFRYSHGLSTPSISPPLNMLAPSSSIRVAGEHVLRFGMLEGEAIVDAEMAVYDPQSAYSPSLFSSNGSRAGRLAIVCNRLEARLLTGKTAADTAAQELRRVENAELVVVKCGSQGALLCTSRGVQHIPAYRTTQVWPIGSGDVFAAAFFYHWTKGDSAEVATDSASRAAAYYCGSKSLPLPESSEEFADYLPLPVRDTSGEPIRPAVYLAGPFFNMAERWLVNEARNALLDQGMKVFSPLHDVGIGSASEVVPADIKALTECDVVFALLDHLDSGTVFEVGYARSIGKPVVGFCQNATEDSLKMLRGTDVVIVNDFVSAIYQTAWAVQKS